MKRMDKYCKSWWNVTFWKKEDKSRMNDFTLTWQYFSSTWSATILNECAISLQVNCIWWSVSACNRCRRSSCIWQSLTISGKGELFTKEVVEHLISVEWCRCQCRRRGVRDGWLVEYGRIVVWVIDWLID